MPGVTAWFPWSADAQGGERFRAAQRLMLHGKEDAAVVDVEEEGCFVGHVGAPSQPVRVWKEGPLTIVLEGTVLGRTEPALRAELARLAQRAFAADDALGPISEFVRGADGDFLAVFARAGRCLAFGDALGHLPVYVQQDGAGLAFARECKFLAALRRDWAFDPLGLAQHFWLGFPSGRRTLFAGIERAAEGFFLDSRGAPRSAQTYALRCDAKSDARGLAPSAAELAERLRLATSACAELAPELPPIVSLSGGHDSRAILAAAARARPDSIAATFRRAGGSQAADVRVAEQVARLLGVPWTCVELPEVSAADEARLVWLKDGLNHAAMAFILPFLDELARRFGDRAVLLTGDGGDKLFPDLRPVRRASSLERLAELVVDENALLPAAEVELAFGLARGTLVDDLKRRLAEYPETALEQKAIHWRIAERSRKWLFEGEDRNRAFLRHASPCWSRSVVEAALRVPDEHKTDFRFYAEVQRCLDPALLSLPHADTGMSIASARFRAHALARRWTLRAVGPMRRKVVRTLRRAEAEPVGLRAETLAELEGASGTGSRLLELLRLEHARALVERAPRRSLHDWRTVLLLDRVWSERIPRGGSD